MSSEKQKIELYKKREIGDIFTDTIALIRNNFKTLFLGLFYINMPVLLLLVVLSLLGMKDYSELLSIIQTYSVGKEETIRLLAFWGPVYLLIFFLFSLMLVLTTTISFSFIKLYRDREEITSKKLWEITKRYVLKVMGGQYLLIICSMTLVLVSILLGILFTMTVPFLVSIKILLVTILIILVLVLFFSIMIKTVFYPHYIIVEDKGIIESLKLSYEFSKGYFWKIFSVMFCLGIITSFMGYIFQLPGFIVSVIIIFLGISEYWGAIIEIVLGLLGMLFAYFLNCIIYIGISVTYYSILEEREGIQLSQDIDSIGQKNE